MKYVDEYRDKKIIKEVADSVKKAVDPGKEYRFMEVCGTHTMAIAKFGLKHLLPPNVKMLSGPGCPVCVTPASFIDKAIAYARLDDVIITTFGDMIKVPGSDTSLEKARSERGNIKIVYSPLDAVEVAIKNPEKRVVFLGVGFETTAPTIAAAIVKAKKKNVRNFSVLSGHKTMPAALKALISDEKLSLDGFILPAHVSAIIGSRPYGFISSDYNIPCVIAGFEPLDIMQGIYMLIDQILKKKPQVEIQYDRVARPDGNTAAQKILDDVFDVVDSEWRGLGTIPGSGLAIRKEFSGLDAENIFSAVPVRKTHKDERCICGEVLKGLKEPKDCRLYSRACTPEHPIGPCMVSSEGTCSAWFLHS